MAVRGFDHLAITVADPQRTVDFYRRVLGFEVYFEELFRQGRIPVLCMRAGANLINVHPAAAPAKPHADRPTPGSVDLCFRWSGPIDSAVARLKGAGVEILEGPVARIAADGSAASSVYFRDPDQNLIELLTTDGIDPGRTPPITLR